MTIQIEVPAALVGDVPLWVLEDSVGAAVVAADDATEMWGIIAASSGQLEGDPMAIAKVPDDPRDQAQVSKIHPETAAGPHVVLYGPVPICDTCAAAIRTAELVVLA